MNHRDILDFFIKIGNLKRLPRTGWIRAGIKDPESVAEHSYRVCLISMILSSAMEADLRKAMSMAILHDLAEVITGDLTPDQKKIKHEELEAQAMREALSHLPDKFREEYFEIWREYRAAETLEAVIVRDADKLEMVIQAFEYEKEGATSDALSGFWDTEVKTAFAKKIMDSLKVMKNTHRQEEMTRTKKYQSR